MPKRVAIIQSNYIPWKGYFNIINYVDAFVLLDDVQYTRRDWRNRNQIKSKEGLKWLTIPVSVKGQYHILIKDVLTTGNTWRKDHWNQIQESYKKSPYFPLYAEPLADLYLNDAENNLSAINYKFITLLNSFLNIRTPIHWSMEFNTPSEKTERLLYICKELKADIYLSGAAAKDYLDVDLFNQENVSVEWADYSNYPIYAQQFPPFEHGVSVIDLIFNAGENAIDYLKPKL